MDREYIGIAAALISSAAWAVGAILYKKLGVFGLVEMGLFIVILFVGYIYVWKKGALEWE